MDIRLSDGQASGQGRVEILYNDVWGTTGFIVDDDVVCNQLGYKHLEFTSYNYAYFGEGIGPICIDYISCFGFEDKIEYCPFLSINCNNTQDHSDDGGVLCKPYESIGTIDVRLVSTDGRLDTDRGRVEVLHDGEWGTVCSDYWGQYETVTVCRQLGFGTDNVAILKSPDISPGTGRIWLNEIICYSYMSSLDECTYTPWGFEINCTHQGDVGVDCSVEEDIPGNPVFTTWQVVILMFIGIAVVFTFGFVLGIVKHNREERRSRNNSSSSSTAAMAVSYHASSEEIDNPAFSPPPEYRPPSPLPQESPPSYDSVIKTTDTDVGNV